jgi:hypothetical protein
MPQSSADQLQSIPMSPSLGQSLGKAKDFAREQSHRAITLEHLLLALTEDADAAGVLRACNVDIDRLGTDVSGYLGGLLEDMRAPPGTEPGTDPDLLRVVEAACQAASQSRRRTIDGAIVLAAIVGDAKSPAAGLLKAHGMTFEEAIKTLQKASAQARSKQFSPSARASPERPAVEQAETAAPAPAPVSAPTRTATPSPAADAPPSGQMADDFLAAARARIQQRNSSVTAAPDPPAKSPAKPSQADQEDLPLMSLSAFTANRAPTETDVPPLDTAPSQPAVAAAPPTVPQAGGPSSPPGGPLPPPTPGPPHQALPHQGPPPQGAPLQGPPEARLTLPPGAFPGAGDGRPRLPPMPPGGTGPTPPQPRLPDAMPRAERADGPPAPPRRPAANGALPGQRRPAVEQARPPARSGTPARGGQRAAAGPLMEAIPRKMRVGAATTAQVRIGRDKVDNLLQLLLGNRAQHHPEAVVARVLSVRLRASDGSFSIEPGTPETQWIETSPGHPPGQSHDDHVAWHWTVTPHRRGRRRLQLLVSARTVGRDGIAAEIAPPERVIEVTVRPSLLRRLVRWAFVLALFGAGAALGRLSQDKLAQDLLDVGALLIKNVVGLLRTSGFLAG